MSDAPRTLNRAGSPASPSRMLSWPRRLGALIAAAIVAAVGAASRTGRRQPACGRGAALDLAQDIEAVIDRLAGPVIASLRPAATRLQPVTAAMLAALDRETEMQLALLIESLCLRNAVQSERDHAARAVRGAIDLPQAIRTEVHAARGKVPASVSAPAAGAA